MMCKVTKNIALYDKKTLHNDKNFTKIWEMLTKSSIFATQNEETNTKIFYLLIN